MSEADLANDGVITRTEQELLVDVEFYEASRVRLRKYIVTEQVTLTFAVSHEELQIERETIAESGAGSAEVEVDLAETEAEIVLYAERLVVRKETAPVERVKAVKEIVTKDETVTEDLRHEECFYERDELS